MKYGLRVRIEIPMRVKLTDCDSLYHICSNYEPKEVLCILIGK